MTEAERRKQHIKDLCLKQLLFGNRTFTIEVWCEINSHLKALYDLAESKQEPSPFLGGLGEN